MIKANNAVRSGLHDVVLTPVKRRPQIFFFPLFTLPVFCHPSSLSTLSSGLLSPSQYSFIRQIISSANKISTNHTTMSLSVLTRMRKRVHSKPDEPTTEDSRRKRPRVSSSSSDLRRSILGDSLATVCSFPTSQLIHTSYAVLVLAV